MRRALGKIDEASGVAWLQEQLEYCVRPLLGEPWILDVDTTVKPLYGHQEGAEVGYNPSKPRPALAHLPQLPDGQLRLVLEVEVAGGKAHTAKHAAPGLWALLDRLGPSRAPDPAARRQRLGQRSGDVRGRAPRPALSVQAAPAPRCSASDRAGDAPRAIGRTPATAGRANGGEVRLLGWGRQRRVVICCAGGCAKCC